MSKKVYSLDDKKRRPRSTRPATRAELRQASRVRKENASVRKIREDNKKRSLLGKKTKKDPAEVGLTIWEKILEDDVHRMFVEMGDTPKAIGKFQRRRIMFSLFIGLMVMSGGLFIHKFLFVVGPLIGFTMYKLRARGVKRFYNGWKFQRQLNFSKFTRLIIPYLKASGGNTALYTIFNKILQRTEDEADRRSLYQLMGEMGDNPTDLQPFTDYAERSSGTDMSHLFMSTIFDFQQSTFDTSVIDELGQLASEDMLNSIDEIINFKLRRFVMFPTKVVMSSFILVVGLGAALMLYNFKTIDFSMDMLDPMDGESVDINLNEELDESMDNIDDGLLQDEN